jgi:Uncharacterized protein containing a Zn-finger-like domain
MKEQPSYRFFANTKCRYFPCHEGAGESFNCLFCYCPLYALGDRCGGNYEYLPGGVKSCMKCAVPHRPGGYDYIMSRISEVTDLVKR